jgi:hypothetical protein
MGKDYCIKNKWVKPYKEEISELGINKPNVSVDEIYQYFRNNILHSQELEMNDDFWDEYKYIGNVYRTKMSEKNNYFLNRQSFEKLSQPDRNKFYREMQQLVQKYSNEINELQVTNKELKLEKDGKEIKHR